MSAPASYPQATGGGIAWRPAGWASQDTLGLSNPERFFVGALCFVLLGYAVLGKGFAYFGVAPLFVGEAALALGLVALLTRVRPLVGMRSLPGAALLAFMALGLIRLIADLPAYGVMALRDAVVWGYAAYAIVVAALLIRSPDLLRLLMRRYRHLAGFIILAAGALFLFSEVFQDSIPKVPGTEVPFLSLKAGEVLVHLSGAVACVLVGMRTKSWWMLPMVLLDFAALAMRNRGGMLAFMAAMGVILLLRSRRVEIGKWSYMGLVFVIALVVVNPKIELYGERSISLEQFTDNFKSLTGNSGEAALEGSKKWRINWWTDIVEYTFAGPYFLTGKGFGINLANDDGYQVYANDALRSPHNGHLTVLARMGVPAFLLWMLLQLSWAALAFRNLWRARRRGEDAWHGFFLFLLAYWVAFMINATFDVYIEGPMGGIWFWTLFGVGLGASHIYNRALQ